MPQHTFDIPTDGSMSPNAWYQAASELPDFVHDAAQAAAIDKLDALWHQLMEFKAKRNQFLGRSLRSPDVPDGLYLWGGVGRGKTFLMDAFYNCLPYQRKRRIHFHNFMAEVHHEMKLLAEHKDPLMALADNIAAHTRVLCLDEFHVDDIADAMILGRLFKHLFELQVVIVATSNSPPGRLYENGLNRQLFVPFIELIGEHMDVVELKSAKDYRLEKLAGQPLYFSPADERAGAELDKHWDRLTGHHAGGSEVLEVKGRQVHVPLASMGIARFDFRDLCEVPLGALDYLKLAHTYHTVLIDGIPVMERDRRDVARRFINLIDTLYDNRVCLIASAAAEPDGLCLDSAGAKAFERTASRLIEMRSAEYLEARGTRGQTEPEAAEVSESPASRE